MAGAVTTRYVIKTSTGDRGPYSSAEIGRFLDDGRLRPTTRILDLDTNRAVTAEDAVRAAAAEETTAIQVEQSRLQKERARQERDTEEMTPAGGAELAAAAEPAVAADPAQAARDRRRRSDDLHEATDAIVAAAGGRSHSALERIGPAPTPASAPTPTPAAAPTPRPAARAPAPEIAPAPVPSDLPEPPKDKDKLAITVTVRKEREDKPPKSASRATTITVRPGQIVTPAEKATIRTSRRSRSASTSVDTQTPTPPTARQSRRPGRGGLGRRQWLVIGLVLIGFAVLVCTATIICMVMLRKDRFSDQATSMLHACLAAPETIASYPEVPGLIPLLITRDHPAALLAARLERGTYEGYKPAYDEIRYRDNLREAIAKQIECPDPVLLSNLARDLVSAPQPAAADVATARSLAEKAVVLEQSKNWRSLDTLAWVLFKSGKGEEAAAIERRAMDAASDPVARAECSVSQEQIASGH